MKGAARSSYFTKNVALTVAYIFTIPFSIDVEAAFASAISAPPMLADNIRYCGVTELFALQLTFNERTPVTVVEAAFARMFALL